MKNRFSRFLSLTLAAMMLLAIAPVSALADEPVVLTMAAKNAPSAADYQDRDIVSEIEKRLGIHLDITSYSTDAWETQLSLMMASDELPDILAELDMSRADVNKYGQEGFFLDLSQYLDYMPNFKARLESDPILDAYSRDEHGAIYGISKTRDSLCSRAVAMAYLNKNWLKNVGMEAPTTTEELYQVLKAFKEQDANGNGKTDDEIPLSITFDGGSGVRGEYVIRSAFGIYDYSSNYQPQLDENGKVYLAETTEGWKEYVKYMNRLYTEGLLDSKIFTQTTEEYNAKMSTGVIGVMPNCGAAIIGLDEYLKNTSLKPMTSEYNETPIHPGRAQEVDKFGMVITDKCSEEKAIAAIKLLDYFYSQEGTFLIKCGPEYGAWGDMIDGGYVRHENEDGTVSYELIFDHEKYQDSYYQFRIKNGLMNMPFFYTAAHAAVIIGGSADNSHVTEIVNESGMLAARRMGYPQMATFTEDEQDILAPYVLMDSYVDQMVARFITGEVEITDETWNSYLEQLNMMDLDTLVEVRQAAYDRWNS